MAPGRYFASYIDVRWGRPFVRARWRRRFISLRDHVKYSGISSLALLPFVGLKAEVIYFFLGGVLIDVDHYIDYVTRFKDFGLDGMFEYYCDALHPTNRGSKPYLWLGIFHTVEFFACMYLASLIVPWLWFVMLGMLFHLVLDIIFLYRLNVLQDRAISLI